MFNLENLTPLTVYQIVAYDGLHKKAVFSGLRAHSEYAKKKYCVKREFFGKVDIEHSTLVEKRTELHCKYLDKSRFCLGAASAYVIIDNDDVPRIEGRHCDMFFYRRRWIHTISSYEEQVKKYNRRVQVLKGYCAQWFEDTHPDGVGNVTEPLTMFPGVQATKAKPIS